MKMLSLAMMCLMLTACASSDVCTAKVIKFEPGYYAEWGERDGEAFEDRYDAVICEVHCSKKHMETIAVYQHWFKRDWKDFPAVGSEIRITPLPNLSPSALRISDVYTIELNDFEKLKKPKTQGDANSALAD